jgi:hypothetical protein
VLSTEYAVNIAEFPSIILVGKEGATVWVISY